MWHTIKTGKNPETRQAMNDIKNSLFNFFEEFAEDPQEEEFT